MRANGISVELLLKRIALIYPYVRSELFIQDDRDQALAKTADIVELLLSYHLIWRDDHGILHSPDKAQDESLQLQYLANIMLPTLERYLLTLSVLARMGSGQCSQTVLENQAQQMAQRSALLNGLDAPEFFDKALFKNFIQTLKALKVLTLNEDSKLDFDHRIQDVIDQAGSVIPDDVWYNVYQVTKRSSPPT